MSTWEDFHLEDRIRDILRTAPRNTNAAHLGRYGYMSAYQIAISYAERYPGQLPWKIGGSGTGEHISLAQQFARQLSQKIEQGIITDIEGAWLSHVHVQHISFIYQSSPILPSTEDLTLFRLRER